MNKSKTRRLEWRVNPFWHRLTRRWTGMVLVGLLLVTVLAACRSLIPPAEQPLPLRTRAVGEGQPVSPTVIGPIPEDPRIPAATSAGSAATSTPAPAPLSPTLTSSPTVTPRPIVQYAPTRTATPTVTPITPTTWPPQPTRWVTRTLVPTPTAALLSVTVKPLQAPRVAELCGVGLPPPPRIANSQVLYFTPEGGDWYRTRDLFATYEWLVPAGELAPDLRTRVVFRCQGPGTICVARPIEAVPIPLPLRYEPQRCVLNGCAQWLPDGERLVFAIDEGPRRYWSPTDESRLYLLDLSRPELHQITGRLWPGSNEWAVAPNGRCIAYADAERGHDGHISIVGVSADSQLDYWTGIEADAPELEFGGEPIVAWSSDGRYLAFAEIAYDFITDPDRYILHIWDISAGLLRSYELPYSVSTMQWNHASSGILMDIQPFAMYLDLTTGILRPVGEASQWRPPCATLWLPGDREVFVTHDVQFVVASYLLDVSRGTSRELIYPYSDRHPLENLFLGPEQP